MRDKVMTHAYYWDEQGTFPTFRQMEIPCGENDLVIKVRAAMFGKALYRAVKIGHPKIKPPRVLGTLLAGEVVRSVGPFPCGMNVVINPHAQVGDCDRCFRVDKEQCSEKLSITPGAISEYARISGCLQEGVFQIPPSVQLEEAVYSELVACAQESVRKACDREELIIIGCGLMALIQIQLAVLQGFHRIVCICNHKEREDIIRRFGGIPVAFSTDTRVLKGEVEKYLSGKKLAIIDSAGTVQTAQTALDLAEEGTTVILFAGYAQGASINLDLNKIHYQNIQIVGSYHFPKDTFRDALALISNRKININALITNRIDWRAIDSVYDTFSDSSISSVIIF